jgi:hypothetical protein
MMSTCRHSSGATGKQGNAIEAVIPSEGGIVLHALMAVGDVEERGDCRRGSVRSVDVAVVVNVVAVVQ